MSHEMVLSLWLIWAGLIHVAKVCHKWLKAFLKGHSYVSQLPFHVKFLSDIYISKEAHVRTLMQLQTNFIPIVHWGVALFLLPSLIKKIRIFLPPPPLI